MRLSYNGAQRRGAVVSDDEVVPDSDGEAAMPDPTTTDRLAMSDIATLEIEDEVSRRPIEVNIIRRGQVTGRDETMCREVTSSEREREPAASQQRYDPFRKSENSSRHSRQSDSEASGTVYRRSRRMHDSGRRGIGEQRRSLDDLRAELTKELRTQQAMFLSARDELAARQEEMFTQAQVAFESLRSNQVDARSVNENRQAQPQSSQVGVVIEFHQHRRQRWAGLRM